MMPPSSAMTEFLPYSLVSRYGPLNFGWNSGSGVIRKKAGHADLPAAVEGPESTCDEKFSITLEREAGDAAIVGRGVAGIDHEALGGLIEATDPSVGLAVEALEIAADVYFPIGSRRMAETRDVSPEEGPIFGIDVRGRRCRSHRAGSGCSCILNSRKRKSLR